MGNIGEHMGLNFGEKRRRVSCGSWEREPYGCAFEWGDLPKTPRKKGNTQAKTHVVVGGPPIEMHTHIMLDPD